MILLLEFSANFIPLQKNRTNLILQKFQGPAISVAAIATAVISSPNTWIPETIDQILEDGDQYFSASYKDSENHFPISKLKDEFELAKNYLARVSIDENPFQSESEILESFFKTQNSGILTSETLNVAIWRDDESKHFYFFDPQPRAEEHELSSEHGSAKLIITTNLKDVVSLIPKNDEFELRIVEIKSVEKLPEEKPILGRS